MSSVIVVETALDGRVLLIKLNRPEARNAVNGEMARELAAVMDRLDADPALRLGILYGEGRGFSAGMDLKAFLDGDLPTVEGRGFGGFAQSPPRKPLIAAIEGFAVAGGLELALACDLIVAAHDAKLGLPEVKRSLTAAGGGLLRLAQRIPYHVAAEIALTGDPLPAQRLYDVGLINRLAEPGQALDMAMSLAAQIVDNAPLALEGTKFVLAGAGDWGMAEGWDKQHDITVSVSTSEDAREGATAFAERRPPVWQGR
ncbi:enoyl-CoA hydratase [Aeromicrobium sp. A1-2]|uniref:crotonase/enoyl-CoA hydratase family protein n=1 Tax=Aeromicrobium sp. A1-2 TaxID=2107713 RepID=UPI000E47ED6B|nr:crotonase/enoyl-CoA hydratase family protein [Aeromicrobium sp. A1-2]AXT84374.1 enoyl-CoA hydratase [Aeromicrobium sp. A1-2]